MSGLPASCKQVRGQTLQPLDVLHSEFGGRDLDATYNYISQMLECGLQLPNYLITISLTTKTVLLCSNRPKFGGWTLQIGRNTEDRPYSHVQIGLNTEDGP